MPLFDAPVVLDSPTGCARAGCYSNQVHLADLDGDGDLDAIAANGGGYYEPGAAEPLVVWENDGGTLVLADLFGGWTGRLRQVVPFDADGDGDLDVFAPDSWAMQPDALFINDDGDFRDEGPTRLDRSSRAGAARAGDLDGDGDLDLVVTDWGDSPPDSAGTAVVLLNDDALFTELEGAVPQDTDGDGTGPIDADLFDADGDFDLDLLLASREGESLLFINDGTGHFATADLPNQPGPYVYGPDACDVDGDGDLDLWLDNGADSLREQLLINDGAGRFSDETDDRVTGNPGADDNEVQCADIDDDGDLDAVIASLSDEERVLENDGTGHFTLLADAFPSASDPTLGLDLGDLDGDGRLDAVTVQGESGNFADRSYTGSDVAADTHPPVFRAIRPIGPLDPGDTAIFGFAIDDGATSDVGARIASVTLDLDGGSVDATWVGGDLWRAVHVVGGPGTWTACATDLAGNQACTEPAALDVHVVRDGKGCGCGGGRSSAALLLLVAVRRRRTS